MRFEVLGPLRVHVDGSDVHVRAGRDRTLLAVLVLHVDRIVPVDQLVDALWSDAPPQSARNQVQACVSQLRKRLLQAGLPEEIIATDPAGYRLRVDPEQVDVCQFRALVAGARTEAADGRRTEARNRYRTALDLWQGPALAGIESPEVRRTAAALEEERVQALEERIELDLALGGAGELVGELSDLVQRYPYREGIYAALMRALYRAGRMTDALATFRRARQTFHDELGAEPGEELQRLHQAILNRDDELTVGSEPRTPEVRMAPVPRELPPEVTCFVGREKEIAEVRDALAPANPGSRRRPAVVVLYGPGGIGKSALAVRVAHDLADAFPDGQLYVDLCGSTPGMRPLGALEVLGRFLRSLGVHPSEIPADEAEAAALFRSVTADRRLFLLLDNAATKGQVVSLLPAGSACAVVLTSRHPLSSLDAKHRIRINVLDDAAGEVLLTELVGGNATDSDPLRTILTLAGGLPLAIRIAGGRIACRPDLPLADYAARLTDRSRRLDELRLDDLAVRASVRTGYEVVRMSSEPQERLAARVFRMLGVLAVPDYAPHVVTAMLGENDVKTGATAMDRLVYSQLIEPIAGERYRLHDLVRLVAAEQAAEEDGRDACDEAVARATEFYTAALCDADNAINPDRSSPFGSHPTPANLHPPSFDDPKIARIWIDQELPSLVAVMEQAVSMGKNAQRQLLWLGPSLWSTLDVRCDWSTAHRLSRLLFEATEEQGDQDMAMCALLLCGRSEACLGRYQPAIAYLGQALTIAREVGNPTTLVLTLTGLGIVHARRGEAERALLYYREALQTARRRGVTNMVTVVSSNMSVSYAALGQLDRATNAAERACVDSSGATTRAGAIINLASIHCLRGDEEQAITLADEALHISRTVGDYGREYESLLVRSEANRRLGRLIEALRDTDILLSSAAVDGYRHALAAAQVQAARVFDAMGRKTQADVARAQAGDTYAKLSTAFRDPMIEILLQ